MPDSFLIYPYTYSIIMKITKAKKLDLRITSALYERLQQQSTATDTPVAQIVRTLLNQHLAPAA